MTISERLAQLKPGQTIQTKRGPRVFHSLSVNGESVITEWGMDDHPFERVHHSLILWPDPPKAVPGRIYEHHNRGLNALKWKAIGTYDGKLRHDCNSAAFPLDPSVWTLLPPLPEDTDGASR